MNIVYQFNEKYAPYAGVSITSLFENNKAEDDICVYILGEQLSEDSQKRFLQLADCYHRTIVFCDTEKIISDMKEWGIPPYRGSYAANMRLFLPIILDENVERILYLDADTVVSGTLGELYNMNLEDKAIGMALDSLGEQRKYSIGLNKNDSYYNSGVVLFDLVKWKKEQLSNRIIEHITAGNTSYACPDQDLLNVVCRNDIYRLGAQYNFQPSHIVYSYDLYKKYYPSDTYYTKDEIESAKSQIAIYHFFRFLGEFPWNKNNMHPDNAIFDKYLALSPWNDYQKEKSESTLSMKIGKVLYMILPKSFYLAIFCRAHKRYVENAREIKK